MRSNSSCLSRQVTASVGGVRAWDLRGRGGWRGGAVLGGGWSWIGFGFGVQMVCVSMFVCGGVIDVFLL